MDTIAETLDLQRTQNTGTENGKKNIEHDAAVTQLFQDRGWCVIRIWECELKKKNRTILDAKLASVFNLAELHTLITIILPVRYGIQQSL